MRRVVCIGLLVLLALPASGQEPDPVKAPNAKLRADLRAMTEHMAELRAALKALEASFAKERSAKGKKALTRRLAERRSALEDLSRNFARAGAGIDLESLDQKPSQRLDWQQELMLLLSPLLNELKGMTERPRKMDRLRMTVARADDKLPALKQARARLQAALGQSVPGSMLQVELASLQQRLSGYEKRFAGDRSIAQVQLDQLERERRPMLDSGRDFMAMFFKSRGRNALLALAALIGMFFFMRALHPLVQRLSPFHSELGRTVTGRFIDVLWWLAAFAGSLAAMMGVLYASGDWVLLSIASIMMILLAWTAREGLPRYRDEVKLLLNLGSVREGERVLLLGVPWKVVNLNLRTTLENPCLDQPTLVLPIQRLASLSSRPSSEGESWFPSERGDVVILADGTRGQVISQNPDHVLLDHAGGRKTYQTADYLAACPHRLAPFFFVSTYFGIGYEHQEAATRAIPATMVAFIEAGLAGESWGAQVCSLRVIFASAGASSLDLKVIAKLKAGAATDYAAIEPALQRLSLEAATKHGWELPFPQLVVHRPTSEV